jgi:hypothetical protein
MVNLSTLQPIAPPSGVNTAADEFHPSLTADGRLLAFERVTPPILSQPPPAGTGSPAARQIFVFDRSLRTEVQPSVLGGGDTVKGAPSIAADGSRVIAGTAGDPGIAARVTLTELASPFAQTQLFTPPGTLLGQSTVTPAIGTGTQPLVAWSTRRISTETVRDGDILVGATSTTTTQTQDLHVLRFRADLTGSPQVIGAFSGTDTVAFGHPAIATSGPLGLQDVTALERLSIVSRTSTVCFFGCSTTTIRMPGAGDILVVNSSGNALTPSPAPLSTSLDERLPAWSGDGRFLAFIRAQFIPVGADRPPELRNRILVFDFGTQTLVQGMIFDVGRAELSAPSVGNLSLAQTPDFRIVCGRECQQALRSGGLLRVSQNLSGPVGIIVQRVVGVRRLLGRRVPRLQFVGRVPFGPQRAGTVRIRWDRRVNGRPLQPGRYVITYRSHRRKGAVRELSRPVTLVIPRRR